MKLQLKDIKPSPKPIRSTWDEQKMDDLRWSLMEEGQVEPIGVHKNEMGYTIVWGHRRTEAARRAGWDEIEAVIVPQDEVDNLIQAGIENLSGEDMTADDKAEWAFRLTELGLSQREISRRSSIPNGTIGRWLIYRNEKASGVAIATPDKYNPHDAGIHKVIEVVRALGDDLDGKKVIAQKVTKDELTTKQTRAVAEAYRDAPTPEVKEKILQTPVMSRDTADDILTRAKVRVEMDKGVESVKEIEGWKKDREEKRAMDEWDHAVKEFLDSTRYYRQMIERGYSLIKYNKFSLEAARFTIRKIDGLIAELEKYRDELEGIK